MTRIQGDIAYRKIQGGGIKNIGALPATSAEWRDRLVCIRQGHTGTSIFSGATYAIMEDSLHGEVATFAAGCFWDLEAEFRRRESVIATRVGYTGGDVPDPTYEQVSSGNTGHVEAVQVIFNPARISYADLLDVFWNLVPVSQEKGTPRPVIFYHSPEQRVLAESFNRSVSTSRGEPVPLDILPAGVFWPAEECHQQYYEKCARGYSTTQTSWE